MRFFLRWIAVVADLRRAAKLLVALLPGSIAEPLDDLVELTAVEPDAAAFRAVVDLDSAAVAHLELRSVVRTVHVASTFESVTPVGR